MNAHRFTVPPCTMAAVFAMTVALAMNGCERVDMKRQPRYKALQSSFFFADGASARPLVVGTVAQSDHVAQDGFTTGWVDQAPITDIPVPPTMNLLLRGQERYNIYCAPCHGLDGSGDGIVVERGYTAPPSFHTERLRITPVGLMFSAITDGFGRMPPYAQQIQTPDRWAIIAYIRALQLTQHATAADLAATSQSSSEVDRHVR